jgi:hypothetical protein
MDHYLGEADRAIMAIGNNAVREKLMRELAAAGFEWATLFLHMAIGAPSAVLRPGSSVIAGAILFTEYRVCIGSIVICGGVVVHNSTVEDLGHLIENVSMAGGTLLWRGGDAGRGYTGL